jgi:hypothetical protein
MNRIALCICVVVAAALTVAGAAIQGSYSSRGGTPSALAAAGQRLQSIPQAVGPWRMRESETWNQKRIDMLQCSGYIHRTYVHRKTGQAVNVAVLVGPPGPTSVHIPEICYKSEGYDIAGASQRFEVPRRGADADEFWGVTFRALNQHIGLLQVGYGWSDGGPWVAPDHPRVSFGGRPLLYKLQLAVVCPASSDIRHYDVCRDFLADFLPVLQQSLVKPSSP